jgi:hypothetical protein
MVWYYKSVFSYPLLGPLFVHWPSGSVTPGCLRGMDIISVQPSSAAELLKPLFRFQAAVRLFKGTLCVRNCNRASFIKLSEVFELTIGQRRNGMQVMGRQELVIRTST